MATPEEINDKLERLIDLMSNGRFASTSTVGESGKNLNNAFSKLETAIARSNAALKISEGSYKRQAERQREAARSLEYVIEAIDEQVELLEKEGKLAEANLLREQKREAERNKLHLKQSAAFKEVLDQTFDFSNAMKLAGSTITTATTAVGNVMTSLQGNAKATDSAGAVLKAGVGLAGAAAEGLGKGLETAGDTAIAASFGMKGYAKGLTLLTGSLMSAAGTITSKGSPLLVKGFGFFYDFMSREFEALGEGFRRTSNAGALFANGMTGMTDAAGKAGLTLQQFGGVVEKSRDSLVKSGLSVSGSMALLSQTSGIIRAEGNEVGRQLNNLGYTFEEQTGLIAETMGNLGRFGSLAGMSQSEVTDATLETAKSMKLLAGLAGEDAKAKREATRKANDEVAFKSKLLQLEQQYGKGYAKKVEDSMAQLDSNTQQMIRERIKYGGVISQDLAVMTSTIPAMAGATNDMTDAILGGAINSEMAARRQGKANDEIVAQASEAGNTVEILGMALKGPAQSMAKAFESTLTQALAMGSAAVEKQIESMNKAAETSDPLIKNYVSAMEAHQKAMVAQQGLAIDNMAGFAGLVADVNKQILNALNLIKEGLGEKTIWQSIKDNILTVGSVLMTVLPIFKMIKGAKLFGGAAGSAAAATGSVVGPVTGPAAGGAAATGKILTHKARYDELRKTGMSPADALAQAKRERPLGTLSAAEGRIKGGVPTPTSGIPATTTVPTATPAGPASSVLGGLKSKALSVGRFLGPASMVAGAGAAGYGIGSLINEIPGFREGLGGIIDRATGASKDRAKLLESTPINISAARPVERPATTGAAQQIIERQTTQTTNTIISELSLPTLPLNVNTKEMRDSLLKQIEKMTELSSLNEQMLNQLRENNGLVKQLLNATA